MTTPRKPRRSLSEAERTLWHDVARSIKPLRGRRKTAPAPNAPSIEPPKARPKPAVAATLAAQVRQEPKSAPAPDTLDRRTKRKLARGAEPIEARLDLHGMTQAQAYHALVCFLVRSQRDGARYVLVVTGKGGRGQAGERGVLRRRVPLWLELPELRDVVLGFDAAHVGHGGEGALYVRLRRARAR